MRTGDFVYLPRGTTHCFRNMDVNAARMLILTTPAGFERFFAEAGVPARPGEQAPPLDPAEFGRIAELSAKYGGRIVAAQPAGSQE